MGKFNITIIVVLFLSALVLWILDVTNFIVKIKLTLLGSSNSSIADKYARAKKVVFVRQAAIDVIYSYMLIPVIGNIPGVETKRASSFAFLVYSYSTSVIVGLYPTIIVVLAHSQHAVLKTEADTQLPTITWRVAELPTETQLLQSRIDLVKEGTRRDDIEIDLTALGEEGTPEPLHKISHPPAATPQEMLETQTLERQPL
ncbi:hypothetical protein H0H92_008096 [Tricholoma furcatifolium]|nr:hypothetical protein H0H92_008096 [Tricholoma furcatifolium]